MERKSIKNLIQNGWRSLILHPFFYNGISCLLLMIVALSIGLLNYKNPFSIVNCFNIVVFFFALLGFFQSYKNKRKEIILYSVPILALSLPAINILFNAADIRLEAFTFPVVYLIEFGIVCHALKSKLHGIFITIFSIGLIVSMSQPEIVFESDSIGVKIILVIIFSFTTFIFFILYSWNKMQSFLPLNEKQLIDKIGEVVATFSNILIKNDDVSKVLANVAHRIIPSLEFEYCVIYLLDEDRKVLIQESGYGAKSNAKPEEIVNPLIVPLGQGIIGTVAATGVPEIIIDTSKDSRYIINGEQRFSELCVPIIVDNKVIGVIDSEHSSKKFFNEVHLYLMQIIAAQCASKITEIRHRTIHEQSIQLELESKKLQETDLVKSRFISNLSHDLKTPLTLILGPAKELTKRELALEQLDMVDLINKNGLELKQIIDELLALNELNFLSQNPTVETVGFDSLMTNWVDNFEYRCEQKSISVQIKGHAKREMQINEKKLGTIIISILEHTRKSTPAGGEIKINYGIEGSNFLWEIENSRMLEKGLDQVQQVIEKELFITEQLITSMGGHLTIGPSRIGGIKLEFLLPLKNDTISQKEHGDFPDLLKSKTSEKPIILIIEDHDDLRQFIHQSLEGEFICVSSENGEKGLEMAKKFIPDLIVTDLMLPGINGEEVCAQIRNDEQINHIPIVVLSAKSMTLNKVELYNLGAENYLTKPFEIEELSAIIWNIIQQRRNLNTAFHAKFISEGEEMLDPFIQKVIGIIETHLTNNQLSISTLTSEIKIGRNQLQRKIKMLTNMTPVEFIRNARLKKANKLLVQGELSISEIAYAVGFNNLSYFSRSYKQTYNELPSDVFENNKSKVNSGTK